MMKTSKIISGALAIAMGLTSMSVFSASAEEAVYALGDVDKDGVITGHDSAVVSRALYDDTFSLTEEQEALADMNGDGVVDQSDLEAIHAQEVYVLGDVTQSGREYGIQFDAYCTFMFWSYNCVGISVEIIRSEIGEIDNADWVLQSTLDFVEKVKSGESMNHTLSADIVLSIDEVSYNLMDSDADGKVTYYDAFNLLLANSRACLAHGGEKYDEIASYYGVKGRYDIVNPGTDENGWAILVEKENIE